MSCLSCSRGYKVTLKNLEIAYPELSEAERRKMANESVRQSAKMAAETPAVWFRNEKWRRAKTLSVSNEDLMLAEAFYVEENSRLGCQIPIRHELDGLEIELAPES